jgi:hypothetical protein
VHIYWAKITAMTLSCGRSQSSLGQNRILVLGVSLLQFLPQPPAIPSPATVPRPASPSTPDAPLAPCPTPPPTTLLRHPRDPPSTSRQLPIQIEESRRSGAPPRLATLVPLIRLPYFCCRVKNPRRGCRGRCLSSSSSSRPWWWHGCCRRWRWRCTTDVVVNVVPTG